MRALKIFFILFILATTQIFVSCTEDWLNEEHETRLTVDAIYNTPEGISNAAVGLYYLNRQLLRMGSNNWSQMYAGLIRGTDIEVSREGPLGSAAYAYYRPQEINTYRYHQTFWDMYYGIIGKANEIIYHGVNMESADERVVRAIAEARYFRAYSYLFLYERFENIYLNTEPVTPDNIDDERIYLPSAKQEVFEVINTDLDLAIEALDITDLGEPGRITKGAARHVRMITAMWQEDWDEAIFQGEAMEESGMYELMPLDQLFGQADYSSDHTEAITTWQYFEGLGGADYAGQWGYSGHRLKALFLPEYERRNAGEYTEVNGGFGLAWLFPNEYLLSLYDQETDNRYNTFYRHEYYFTNAEAAAEAGLEVGDVIPKVGAVEDDFRFLHTGLRKYEDITTYPITDSKGFSDVMQYRYAQTCIHMAEAYLKDGNMAKALEWYNKTWTRAGNPKREQPLTMDDIRDEHARELGLEGHRWTYLKRIGDSQSQITQFAGEEPYNIEARTNWQPHHVRWPIPQEQLQVFGEGFPQNEGYPR